MPSMTHAASLTVATTPERAYALFSDVTRTGEWSPTCVECTWHEGARAEFGGTFTGKNVTPDRTWETQCEVTVADGTSFGWKVGPDLVRWTYLATPGAEDGTTTLTESWEFTETGQAFFIERFGEAALGAIEERTAAARSGIEATLAAMKQILETS